MTHDDRSPGALAKRLFDLYFAAVVLLALAPVFALVAVLIKLSDGGPVFYRGTRVGRGGRHFRMYKFRTMVLNADKIGGASTAERDPRITRVGRFLRRTKLDEFPQFINVLRGEMSVVGPRPQVPSEFARYSEADRQVVQVRPGITDLSSIRFRNEGEILQGQPDPDAAYWVLIHPEKMRLALYYVENHSLRMDLQLVLYTVAAVAGIKSKGLERALTLAAHQTTPLPVAS